MAMTWPTGRTGLLQLAKETKLRCQVRFYWGWPLQRGSYVSCFDFGSTSEDDTEMSTDEQTMPFRAEPFERDVGRSGRI